MCVTLVPLPTVGRLTAIFAHNITRPDTLRVSSYSAALNDLASGAGCSDAGAAPYSSRK